MEAVGQILALFSLFLDHRITLSVGTGSEVYNLKHPNCAFQLNP